MSKIICDVCGTSYSETATQCPICGCVRPGDAVTVAGDTNEVETPVSGTYNYVKGGRFSKANVKKRNRGATLKTVAPKAKEETQTPDLKRNEKPFIIAVVVLLLAIIAIVVYIAVRFFAMGGLDKPDDTMTENTTASSTVEQTEATLLEIPCVELTLSKTLITFDKPDAAVLLSVSLNPVDTTDVLFFHSQDETVATVSEDGKVIAVGPGDTVITVTCGDAIALCDVMCTFENSSQETTQETISAEELKLNRDDFTLSNNGDSWNLYNGAIPADQITWTSDDEKVATIKNGVVTAVGGGYTTVYGEYMGVKVSCIVRCSGPKYQEPVAGEETVVNSDYTISHTDVTIGVGETFQLTLTDKDNNVVTVTWTSGNTALCTVSGNTVTGVAVGNTVVTATYDGVIYKCIVRIS